MSKWCLAYVNSEDFYVLDKIFLADEEIPGTASTMSRVNCEKGIILGNRPKGVSSTSDDCGF